MSFMIALIYDKFMAPAEEACLKDWRRELLQKVHGDVLEIGAGTGANIDFYPDSVNSIVFSEPDKAMRGQLAVRVAESVLKNAIVSPASAEDIKAEAGVYDFIVTSLVCCSVTDLEAVLEQIHRALKPGGRLVFLEHVAAIEGTKRRKWQNRLNPLWRKVAGNCHLNRETEEAIISAGFEISEIKRESMRKAISFLRPTIRGIALKNQ